MWIGPPAAATGVVGSRGPTNLLACFFFLSGEKLVRGAQCICSLKRI